MSRHKDDDVLLAGAGFVAGFWLFYRGFKQLRLKRLIERLATSKTRGVAMGLVELSGRAGLMDPIDDPIYRKPCAYFRIKVEEKRGSGKNSRWVTIYDRCSAPAPFFLIDDTGRVPVFPGGATTNFRTDVRAGGLTTDFDVATFLDKLPGTTGGSLSLKAEIVRENDPVFLVGYAAPPEDPFTLREKLARFVPIPLAEAARRLKRDLQRMAALDVNRDGRIDAEEWSQGLERYHYELQARQLAAGPGAALDVPQAVIRTTPEGFMYLADKSEEECGAELGQGAFLGVFGGPILTVGCAAYLARRFSLL